MPTANDFRDALKGYFYEASKQSQPTVDVNAGNLHRSLGGYPGPNHRLPICCTVMRAAMDEDAGDIILSSPESGQGANLTIRYVLPRRA